MHKLSTSKNYSLITGVILVAFAVIGFAFRNNFNIADKYLFISLMLGAWGLYCAFK